MGHDIGVIGYGGAGRYHEKVAGSLGHLVTKIHDPRYCDDLRHSSVHKMVEEVDGVVVCVPVGLRANVMDILLDSGIPVMVEKPFALCPRWSYTHCRDNNLILADDWCWSEFGIIGPNSTFEWSFSNMESPQYWVQNVLIGGGAITEGGSHVLNWWNYCLNSYSHDSFLEYDYNGEEMYGVFHAENRLSKASMVINIDWTGNERYGVGGRVECGGESIALNWNALEEGFVKEWEMFAKMMDNEMDDIDKAKVWKMLEAGHVTTQMLWNSVIRKLA